MNKNQKAAWTSSLKLDLLANIAGVGWPAIVQFICIPVYIKFLGIEAFGLIGFYLLLQSLLQVLDFGLSPTINRELARYSVQEEKSAEARDLVRTLQAGYWIVGLMIGVAILVAAPSIATRWINAGSFPTSSVRQAVMLMGILAFLQWPLSFYQGGLMGLGRQVLYNSLSILFSTLSSGGCVLILWRVSPTIQAFFWWLITVSAAKTVLSATLLWKSLPASNRPSRFDFERVRSIRQFAVGMSGITVCALLVTQSDKAIVSKLFSLKIFAYYSLASMFAGGLSMIVTSIFNTIFPRFSALAAVNEGALRHLYHRCTQVMSVLILPLAGVFAVFSAEILQLWTKNAEVARNAGPIMTLLVIGSAINGIMNLPYALQLAYGWTSIALWLTILLTLVSVPTTWFAARHYGPLGAAFIWPALNVLYFAIGAPLTHRRLLKGGALKWSGEVALPLFCVLMVAVIGKTVVVAHSSRSSLVISELISVFICSTASAVLVSPSVRHWFTRQLSIPKSETSY